MDDFTIFQEKVKQSFLNFKEHMDRLEAKITDVEDNFDRINKDLEFFKDKIKEVIEVINNLHENKTISTGGSTGNEGVLQRCYDRSATHLQHINGAETLKNEFKDKFLRLTDAEFKLFVAIYSLEEELGHAVSCTELANRLGFSSGYIRDMHRTLIFKGIPIAKFKESNKKTLLSIPKEFRDLKIVSKLIKLRNFDTDQKELFPT